MATIQQGYAVVQKTASWSDDFNMVMSCINEFHMLDLDDNALAAISIAAHRNGISVFVLDALDL